MAEVAELYPNATDVDHLLENLSANFGRPITLEDIVGVEIKSYDPKRDEWRVMVSVREVEDEREST
jgi:hypothetical protein